MPGIDPCMQHGQRARQTERDEHSTSRQNFPGFKGFRWVSSRCSPGLRCLPKRCQGQCQSFPLDSSFRRRRAQERARTPQAARRASARTARVKPDRAKRTREGSWMALLWDRAQQRRSRGAAERGRRRCEAPESFFDSALRQEAPMCSMGPGANDIDFVAMLTTLVIPAKAGIHGLSQFHETQRNWIPAFAGMTSLKSVPFGPGAISVWILAWHHSLRASAVPLLNQVRLLDRRAREQSEVPGGVAVAGVLVPDR